LSKFLRVSTLTENKQESRSKLERENYLKEKNKDILNILLEPIKENDHLLNFERNGDCRVIIIIIEDLPHLFVVGMTIMDCKTWNVLISNRCNVSSFFVLF
jgi:dephospho-CoA kinase